MLGKNQLPHTLKSRHKTFHILLNVMGERESITFFFKWNGVKKGVLMGD